MLLDRSALLSLAQIIRTLLEKNSSSFVVLFSRRLRILNFHVFFVSLYQDVNCRCYYNASASTSFSRDIVYEQSCCL